MKLLVAFLNIVLFAFTLFVLATDGVPREAIYIVFTVLLLLVPILSLVVIFVGGLTDGSPGFRMKRETSEEQGKEDVLSSRGARMKVVAIVCNLALFGFACWAILNQYPHPEEDGVLAYTIVVFLTPIVSLLAIARTGPGDGWLASRLKRKA